MALVYIKTPEFSFSALLFSMEGYREDGPSANHEENSQQSFSWTYRVNLPFRVLAFMVPSVWKVFTQNTPDFLDLFKCPIIITFLHKIVLSSALAYFIPLFCFHFSITPFTSWCHIYLLVYMFVDSFIPLHYRFLQDNDFYHFPFATEFHPST